MPTFCFENKLRGYLGRTISPAAFTQDIPPRGDAPYSGAREVSRRTRAFGLVSRLKEAAEKVGDGPLPDGRGSVSACKFRRVFLSRARQQAVFGAFQPHNNVC